MPVPWILWVWFIQLFGHFSWNIWLLNDSTSIILLQKCKQKTMDCSYQLPHNLDLHFSIYSSYFRSMPRSTTEKPHHSPSTGFFFHAQGNRIAGGGAASENRMSLWEGKKTSPLRRYLPSRELTYPTLGKGKSSSKCHFGVRYVSSLEGNWWLSYSHTFVSVSV